MASTEVARSPLPVEGLDEYRGKWVALRGGEVIASADELEELTEDERVQQGDIFYLVPRSSAYYY